jgi:hypothetical protein
MEFKAVNRGVYGSENATGKYTVNNWDVSTIDQKGKVSDFSAWFEALKGDAFFTYRIKNIPVNTISWEESGDGHNQRSSNINRRLL